MSIVENVVRQSVDKGAPRAAGPRVPIAPTTVLETGLSQEAIVDLLLKTLYVQGARSGQQLTDYICLPFEVVDEQLLWLQERRFIEVLRTTGPSRGGYVFDITGAGRERARDAFEASQYVGPAPVTLKTFLEWVDRQSVKGLHTNRQRVREGFSHLVIKEDVLDSLGPAINSASSLFLYGDPGNGKTVIAEAIATMIGGDIFIPHAVDIDGQIMITYDPVHHSPVSDDEVGGWTDSEWLRAPQDIDRRFVRIKRPVVFVGGELSLEQLDLQYDEYTKMYQAPFQLKAAGGVLIIDDFGRQLVAPRDLLNRWIVPLEKRIDFLTLHTGVKFPVSFDCLLVFATNLEPHELVDEAFLRRIRYKLNIIDPDRAQYEEIFKRECANRSIPYTTKAIDYIYARYYGEKQIPPRSCHPRDILDHILHAARFEEREPVLTPELLDHACKTYFLIMAHEAMRDDAP